MLWPQRAQLHLQSAKKKILGVDLISDTITPKALSVTLLVTFVTLTIRLHFCVLLCQIEILYLVTMTNPFSHSPS